MGEKHTPYNKRGVFFGLPLRIPRYLRSAAARRIDGEMASDRSAYCPGLMAERPRPTTQGEKTNG